MHVTNSSTPAAPFWQQIPCWVMLLAAGKAHSTHQQHCTLLLEITAQHTYMEDAAGLTQSDDSAAQSVHVQPCGKEEHLPCKQALKRSHPARSCTAT
jgi:hypothetical protein